MPSFITQRKFRIAAQKTAINPASRQAFGLIGAWTLDTHPNDCSLFSNDGIWSGDSLNTARYMAGPSMFKGSAGNFVGANDDVVTLPTNINNTLYPFTYALWIKYEEDRSGEFFGITTQDRWWISQNRAYYRLGDIVYIPDVPFGEWCHIAISVQNDNILGYINGVEELSDSVTMQTIAGVKKIGFARPGQSYHQGGLADVRIYDYALSPDKIEDIYLNGDDLYTFNIAGKPVSIGEAPPAINPTPWHLFSTY